MALKKQEDERRKKAGKSKAKVNDNNVGSVAAGGKYDYVQMEAPRALPRRGRSEAGATAAKADVTKQPDYWKKQQTVWSNASPRSRPTSRGRSCS